MRCALSVLLLLLAGCVPFTEVDAKRAACLASGGEWVEGACVYPSTPDTPDEPDTPDVPDEPDTPDAPGTPDGKRKCAPQAGIVTSCWNRPPGGEWVWILEPPVPSTCTGGTWGCPDPGPFPGDKTTWRCPQGRPQAAGPKEHGGVDCFDATPRVCEPSIYPWGVNGETCKLEGRQCVPVGCEGEANGPKRTFCEELLMGGSAPVWHLEVESGTLYLVDRGWGRCVRGSGVGYVWWTFPNGKATSQKMRVSR